ncbi:unnamed protein product, partial [Dibothriocephalus latus]
MGLSGLEFVWILVTSSRNATALDDEGGGNNIYGLGAVVSHAISHEHAGERLLQEKKMRSLKQGLHSPDVSNSAADSSSETVTETALQAKYENWKRQMKRRKRLRVEEERKEEEEEYQPSTKRISSAVL